MSNKELKKEAKIYEVMQQQGLSTLNESVPCVDSTYTNQYPFNFFEVAEPMSDYEQFIDNMGNTLNASYDVDEGIIIVDITDFVNNNQDLLSNIFQQEYNESDFVSNIIDMIKGYGTIDDYKQLNSFVENNKVEEELFSVSDEVKEDSIEKGLYTEEVEVEGQAYIDTLKDRKASIERLIQKYKDKGASQEKLDDLNKKLKDVEIDIENEEHKDKPLIKKEESKLNEAKEETSFSEIIDMMEQADTYTDMLNAAELIKDKGLRQEVIRAINECAEDKEDLAVAYSVITSDYLDYYAMEGYSNIEKVDDQYKEESTEIKKEDINNQYNSIWVIYNSNTVYNEYFNLKAPISEAELEQLKQDIINGKYYIVDIAKVLDAESTKNLKDLKAPVFKMFIGEDNDEEDDLEESKTVEEYTLDDEEQEARDEMIKELMKSGMSEEDAIFNVDEIVKLFFNRKNVVTESVEDYQDKLSIEYMSKIFNQMRKNGWDGDPKTVDKYFNDIMKKIDPNFKEDEKDIERESKLQETKNVIWTSSYEPSEEELQDEYNEYASNEEDPKDYETWLQSYQPSEAVYEVLSEDFTNIIFPMIENQCNEDILLLDASLGRWNGRYKGGKIINADEGQLRSILSDYDEVSLLDTDKGVQIEGIHHDGTDYYQLYTIPQDLTELATAMNYEDTIRENNDEEIINRYGIETMMADELLSDITNNYVDDEELFKHTDLLVPIKNTLRTTKVESLDNDKYSKVIKKDGKQFRYNYKDNVVEYIGEIDGEIEILDSVGLSKENWDNKEARDEYLDQYIMDLNEEESYMTKDLMDEFGLTESKEKVQEADAVQFIKDIEDAKLLGWDGKDETLPEYMEKVKNMREVNKELGNKKENLEENKTVDKLSKMNLKQLYMREFPEEEAFFNDLNEKTTLYDVVVALNDGVDVYEVIFKDDHGDSVVRENVFNLISEALNIDYEDVYQCWLHPEEHPIKLNEELKTEAKEDKIEEPDKIKEPEADKAEDEDELENKTIYDLLVEREGQVMSVGEFNSLIQSIFAQFNTVFLLQSDLYNVDPEETIDVVVWDDNDMYTITLKIDDIIESTIEIVNVEVE